MTMLIAVDGPAAAGKGTLCKRLASHFDLAILDTGLIYRAVAHKLQKMGDPMDKDTALKAASSLTINDLHADGLRRENTGTLASKIATISEVRKILINFQRDFANNPPAGKSGAILDGRDIGTIVCPEAPFKLFITADPSVRAERRYKELQERGETAIRSAILKDIVARDIRDRTRTVSPMRPARDAKLLDTSELDPDSVFNIALEFISSKKISNVTC